MIREITIANIASYGKDPVVINNLKEINYFFGANASGKTTISRVISQNGSNLTWYSTPIDCFVYNSDFIEKNFNESKDIKGIFTLGSGNKYIEDRISSKIKEKEELREKLISLKAELDGDESKKGKKNEKLDLEKEFEDKFWNKKSEFEKDFADAFIGYNKSKNKLKNRLLDEYRKNHERNDDQDDLIRRAKILFQEDPVKEEQIQTPPHIKFEEATISEILEKVILGKEDVEIGKFWERLHNSDWVKNGKEYIGEDKKCPFCSRSLDDKFIEDLCNYFDDEYQNNMKILEQIHHEYNQSITTYKSYYKSIIDLKSKFIDYKKLELSYRALEVTFEKNSNILRDKINNPSAKYNFNSHEQYIAEIDAVIKQANLEIQKVNSIIENSSSEKTKLIDDIWNFLVSIPLKSEIEDFLIRLGNIEKAINSLTEKIESTDSHIEELEKEISELEKSKSGVKATIESINKTLTSFGFKGFRLAESDNNTYKLVRDDGCPVERNLSEGERTFVIFLYFYHLLEGNFSNSNINTPRVVVIDDPISSLDSNVLFIVASLVKEIKRRVLDKDSNFKQLFVLTHNVYFFRQVTFCGSKDQKEKNKNTFWIIRKKDVSTATQYNENPIKTSYQLLWHELRVEKDHNALITSSVCNTMRRILENYFKYMGGINNEKLIESFSNEEKHICNSLLAFVNAGSHCMDDDEFFTSYDETISKYLDVFKRIFENSGHIAHYNMMMEIEN